MSLDTIILGEQRIIIRQKVQLDGRGVVWVKSVNTYVSTLSLHTVNSDQNCTHAIHVHVCTCVYDSYAQENIFPQMYTIILLYFAVQE